MVQFLTEQDYRITIPSPEFAAVPSDVNDEDQQIGSEEDSNTQRQGPSDKRKRSRNKKAQKKVKMA